METRVKEGRTALAITILLIATLTIPTVVIGGGFGWAQSQQSPSPTGTAPQVELVNPSDYEGKPVLSDKDNRPGNDSSGDDPADERYHFNAWTRNAPNNAVVEFFIVQDSNQISLGNGTNRGNGVYDVFSGIPDSLNEGNATVRVVMFSGGEIDRDEQDVTINQQNDGTDTLQQGERRAARAAETAEMTYPQNAQGVGFFGRQGQPKAAQIELTHSRTAAEGAGLEDNAGPENIRVYFTTSFRGTDPDWTNCGDDESQDDAANGVRCELPSGVQPESVTGIAVVTLDAEAEAVAPGGVNAENTHNAGDAHVAQGYTQIPSAVTITSPGGSIATGCSPLIPVTVNDQIGRKIVEAPVDVHAQGPSDSLAFNTEDAEHSSTDQTKPDPNDQPENHPTEQGRKCSDGSLSSQNQGEHEEAGAQPDRKHIESTNGTDSNGQFVYQMWSNTAGGTAMTAFVDMDDDDQFCASEASGNGVITWGTGGPSAPQPAGPDEQTCTASGSASPSGSQSSSPSSTASPTPSPTPSPSGSTTASSSPSPTPSPSGSSASPSGSASSTSPTSTASPTATPTPGTTQTSPQQAAVEVTLETSQPRKTFGKSFTLTGSVSSDNPACTDFVDVRVLRDVVGGEDEFELFAQETTDANGAFSVTDRADRSASYIAQVTSSSACDDATSAPQPVLVRVKVTLRLSRNRVPEGGRVRFTIKTAPCPATARDRVLLFRAIDGEFGKAGRKTSNGRCVASIVREVDESSVFQGRWPKQRPDFLAGSSRSKAVRVTD